MYPTDLSDARWKYIKKTLQFDDRKRKHSLREIWNGILYLVKTGCQWRMLPSNFPKWQLANWMASPVLLQKVGRYSTV
ncbi:transposase [Dyadobacter jejuensis]|uniref:transposase n=1 Tax=Dyadobacter jejuensis TaxID=1082580 RepID=UPI0035B5C5AB